MRRNTLVLKPFAFTLWEYRQVFEIYTKGVSIGPRYLHFGDISDLQNSLIFRKIAFIRPVRQLEFRRKASVMGIRNSHIVKNRGQHAKKECYVAHQLSFSFFYLVLTFFYLLFLCSHTYTVECKRNCSFTNPFCRIIPVKHMNKFFQNYPP